MSNIERHTGSALAIGDEQTNFTADQVAALRQLGAEDVDQGTLSVFFHQCQRTMLDPFARQIYLVGRRQKDQRTNNWVTKYTIQTGIDGFRLIARRATDAARGTFGYEDTLWADRNGRWHDVWLSDQPPAAAKVTVIRDGQKFPGIALFNEYAGTKSNGDLTKMWADKGALMLAKCAEALALRKAFPQDLSGLYTSDEMQQADNGQQVPQQASASRTPKRAATSNHDRAAQALGIDTEQSEPTTPRTLSDDEFDKALAWIEKATNVDQLKTQRDKAADLDPAQGTVIATSIDVRLETLEGDGDTVDAEVVEEPAA
jgi:phage recombination protein Bet